MQEQLQCKNICDIKESMMQGQSQCKNVCDVKESRRCKNNCNGRTSMMQKKLWCKNICHAKEVALNKSHKNWMMKHKRDYNIKTIKINPQHNGATRDVEWQEIMCDETPLATKQYTNHTGNNIAWPKTTTNSTSMCKEPTIAKLDEKVNNQTKMEKLKWALNHKNSQRSNNSKNLWSTTK